MQIIISPAKKMRFDYETQYPLTVPYFIENTKLLHQKIISLSFDELKEVLACNDQIVAENRERYQQMDFDSKGSPALLSYDGIQYKYMAPQIFENDYYEYVSQHLRILSGFYGVLKPFDAIYPYRLEMQAKFDDFSVYQFWGDQIYHYLMQEDQDILNLASKEYSKTIEKYLSKEQKMVSCVFGSLQDGRVKEKGVYVKMARGEMVRFLASEQIHDFEGVKRFKGLGFKYNDQLSTDKKFVFIREES